jgi:tRNA U34 5-methylaminomethyl-2-thiouridine-forming methyltransferase MnmC
VDQNGVEWRDGGVPVSRRFDDPYFSLENGLAETRHTFLEGNDLPARFRDGFRIAELGFGTGLNLLAAVRAAGASRIAYTGFEAYPLRPAEMEEALGRFPELSDLAAPLVAAWATRTRRFEVGPVAVEIVDGDARVTLPR